MPKKNITFSDIAKYTNFSKTTISRYFNNPDSLTRIICYMEDHLADATLEGAASQIHLSTDYLSRLFRKKTGISFSEYLLNARMKEAGALMKQIHLSIGEIASRLGYKNPKNFTRAFRNYYGMAPTEYRRQTDEEDNL